MVSIKTAPVGQNNRIKNVIYWLSNYLKMLIMTKRTFSQKTLSNKIINVVEENQINIFFFKKRFMLV
jgi:hypothetical protein